jgi:hypothetical protein
MVFNPSKFFNHSTKGLRDGILDSQEIKMENDFVIPIKKNSNDACLDTYISLWLAFYDIKRLKPINASTGKD